MRQHLRLAEKGVITSFEGNQHDFLAENFQFCNLVVLRARKSDAQDPMQDDVAIVHFYPDPAKAERLLGDNVLERGLADQSDIAKLETYLDKHQGDEIIGQIIHAHPLEHEEHGTVGGPNDHGLQAYLQGKGVTVSKRDISEFVEQTKKGADGKMKLGGFDAFYDIVPDRITLRPGLHQMLGDARTLGVLDNVLGRSANRVSEATHLGAQAQSKERG